MTEVHRHTAVMDEYLFTKKHAALGSIRADVHRLLNIEQSMEYRLGKRLLSPLRRVLAKLHRGRKQENADSVREPLTSPPEQK